MLNGSDANLFYMGSDHCFWLLLVSVCWLLGGVTVIRNQILIVVHVGDYLKLSGTLY